MCIYVIGGHANFSSKMNLIRMNAHWDHLNAGQTNSIRLINLLVTCTQLVCRDRKKKCLWYNYFLRYWISLWCFNRSFTHLFDWTDHRIDISVFYFRLMELLNVCCYSHSTFFVIHRQFLCTLFKWSFSNWQSCAELAIDASLLRCAKLFYEDFVSSIVLSCQSNSVSSLCFCFVVLSTLLFLLWNSVIVWSQSKCCYYSNSELMCLLNTFYRTFWTDKRNIKWPTRSSIYNHQTYG